MNDIVTFTAADPAVSPPQDDPGIVALRDGGAREALFLLHGPGDDPARTWAALAAHLDAAIPLHAVQAWDARLRTIEAMAAQGVAALRAVQPQGPYRLLARGAGGVLAYEMAVQLLGQDQDVAFLGMVDSAGPAGQDASPAQRHYAAQPLPLPVHLFRSGGAPLAGFDTLAWKRLLPPGQPEPLQLPPSEDPAHPAALGRAVGQALDAMRPRGQTAELSYHAQLSIQGGRRGRAPLFCVPGAGNSVTGFAALAQAIGPEWPVHGLQPRGVGGDMVPHATVEAAAAQYLGAIEAVAPQGPVHLLGHSFGGWIALELAHLLGERGREVASLSVIDGEAPGGGVLSREYTALEALLELVEVMEMAAPRPLGLRAEDLAPLDGQGRLRLLHERLVRAGMLPARTTPAILQGVARTFGAALRTVYRPRAPYPGALRLMTVSDTRLDAGADRRRCEALLREWQRWAPDLRACHGPGNHMTVLDAPHVDDVADWWHAAAAVPALTSIAAPARLPATSFPRSNP